MCDDLRICSHNMNGRRCKNGGVQFQRVFPDCHIQELDGQHGRWCQHGELKCQADDEHCTLDGQFTCLCLHPARLREQTIGQWHKGSILLLES